VARTRITHEACHATASGPHLVRRWRRSLRAAEEERLAAFDTTGHRLLVNRSILVVLCDEQRRTEGEDGYGDSSPRRRDFVLY
jgi:hypothetical protein